ncbi:unnamed protein product, partial [Didymodactylos carnosus]
TLTDCVLAERLGSTVITCPRLFEIHQLSETELLLTKVTENFTKAVGLDRKLQNNAKLEQCSRSQSRNGKEINEIEERPKCELICETFH